MILLNILQSKNNGKLPNLIEQYCHSNRQTNVPTIQSRVATCQTWSKTYNNLFDFTAPPSECSRKSISIAKQCGLTKVGEHIQICQPNHQNCILRIQQNKNTFLIEPNPNVEKLVGNQLWLVIKSLPTKRYNLREGDTFRVGKQRIKVKQIIPEDNQTDKANEIVTKFKVYQNLTKQNSAGYDPDPNTQQPICRVCLQQSEVGTNPLLAPCKCSGSAKFIHIKCIQQWFSKIMNPRKIGACIQLDWKPLVCQLCGQSLPFKLYMDQCKYFTVNIPRPDKPYLVLNPITKEKTGKSYYLLSLKQKQSVLLGRKKDSDMVIDEDSTISRYHSRITHEKGQIFLSDNQSKFGTLVLLRKPLVLSSALSGLTIQFGGTTATIDCNKKLEMSVDQAEKMINQEEVNEDSDSNDADEEDQKVN